MLNNYTNTEFIDAALKNNSLLNGNNQIEKISNKKDCNELSISKNSEMKKLYNSIPKIALADSSVLIRGESGTGKEYIADLIQSSGNRSRHPYIKVNCSSIPENLFESEFMGVEKGAFTDAEHSRAGYLEKTADGILFLDGIDGLSINLQAKLLQIMKTRRYYKLGSSNVSSFTGRIIASCRKDLKRLVQNNQFREELYYLLAVISLYVPPLHQRKEDIIPLAENILDKISKKNGSQSRSFSVNALKYLSSYGWPGNIRELENKIERALIFSRGNEISENDLFPETVEINKEDQVLFGPLKKAVIDFKKQYIIQTLDSCGWNQTAAAKVLEIQRTYLSRLMKELDIKQIKGDNFE